MNLPALSTALAAVCPIDGVGSWSDSDPRTSWPAKDGSRWRIDFRPEATDAQRQAAVDALAGYVDPVLVRAVTSKQVRFALNHLGLRPQWDAAWATQKQDDRDWFDDGGPYPVIHKRIVHMMGVAGADAGKVTAQAVTE